MTQSTDPKDDFDLFREAMQGVKPLKSDNKIAVKVQRQPRISKKVIQPRLADDTFSDHIMETVTGGQSLSFARAGIQHKVLLDLRRGRIPHNALLDLHGMTVIQARQVVSIFLKQCLRRSCKCIIIVHGKGALDSDKPPPLKNHLNSWLQQSPDVLAFSSALPRDGGTGAVYVLLRRQKSNDL